MASDTQPGRVTVAGTRQRAWGRGQVLHTDTAHTAQLSGGVQVGRRKGHEVRLEGPSPRPGAARNYTE